MHEHTDDLGFVYMCWHKCRPSVTSVGFWLGLTVGFPFEHLLWEKLWPFKLVTAWLGL